MRITGSHDQIENAKGQIDEIVNKGKSNLAMKQAMESGMYMNQYGGVGNKNNDIYMKQYHMNFIQEMTTYQTKEVTKRTSDGREVTTLETVASGFDPMQFYTRFVFGAGQGVPSMVKMPVMPKSQKS